MIYNAENGSLKIEETEMDYISFQARVRKNLFLFPSGGFAEISKRFGADVCVSVPNVCPSLSSLCIQSEKQIEAGLFNPQHGCGFGLGDEAAGN